MHYPDCKQHGFEEDGISDTPDKLRYDPQELSDLTPEEIRRRSVSILLQTDSSERNTLNPSVSAWIRLFPEDLCVTNLPWSQLFTRFLFDSIYGSVTISLIFIFSSIPPRLRG